MLQRANIPQPICHQRDILHVVVERVLPVRGIVVGALAPTRLLQQPGYVCGHAKIIRFVCVHSRCRQHELVKTLRVPLLFSENRYKTRVTVLSKQYYQNNHSDAKIWWLLPMTSVLFTVAEVCCGIFSQHSVGHSLFWHFWQPNWVSFRFRVLYGPTVQNSQRPERTPSDLMSMILCPAGVSETTGVVAGPLSLRQV